MWLFTSEVSTVPGTVAVYQPSALNWAEATSAPACVTLATSCNCQPADTTSRSCEPTAAADFADRVPCPAGFVVVACAVGVFAEAACVAGFVAVTCPAGFAAVICAAPWRGAMAHDIDNKARKKKGPIRLCKDMSSVSR